MAQHTPSSGSVSHGTLREEDLIPAFYETLKFYDPPTAAMLREEYRAVFDALDNGEIDREDENLLDDTNWLIDDLSNALDEIAPEGLHFGVSEGDGADFGFWPIEWPA